MNERGCIELVVQYRLACLEPDYSASLTLQARDYHDAVQQVRDKGWWQHVVTQTWHCPDCVQTKPWLAYFFGHPSIKEASPL